MDKLSINLNEYVKDAFYAIPDFCDENGNHLGGIYGSLFKLIGSLKNEEISTVEIIRKSTDLTPIVELQAEETEKLIKVKLENELVQEDEKFSFSVNEDVVKKLEEALNSVNPTGDNKAIPQFALKMRSTSDLNEVEEIFRKASGQVAFYLLTDNAAKDGGKHKNILGVAVCYDETEAVYIPIENFITESYIGTKLSELSKKASLITFDIKEAFRIFTPDEIDVRDWGYADNDNENTQHLLDYKSTPRCFDTLIGAYLCNPNKNDYEPWDIAKEYCNLHLEKKADIFGKGSLLEADDKKVTDFACKIAYVCFKAAPAIRKELQKEGMEELFFNIEMPLSYILFAMEKEGIIAKKDELKAYGDKLQVRISELEKDIYEEAGTEFNINSPKQLGEILFEKLGLPAEKKTKSGYSTAAEVLEKLAPEHKVVADILEYRGLAKLKSTYADGLADFIEEDGRIHTSFNQTITATGRISSTDPNLQNIPMRTELGRLIRKVFVPKDGYVFADADYSQIELRILAHMSEDSGLIDAYHEGKDIHGITASKVFHVPFEEVTPIQRRNAKAVNFGSVYGISSFGLSRDLSISVGEAKDYMNKYFETYPGVKNYQEKVILEAKEKGYSLTMFGRRRPIPELKSNNFNIRQFGERVAMNAPIQGTAADIMKIAMINVFFRLKKENLQSRLILQIHDELVIETSPDEVDKVTDLLTSEMEKAVKLAVPLEAECHTGSDWYEAK